MAARRVRRPVRSINACARYLAFNKTEQLPKEWWRFWCWSRLFLSYMYLRSIEMPSPGTCVQSARKSVAEKSISMPV